MSDSDFTWRDGERTIHFRAGVVAESPEILRGHEFGEYELLTTERAMGAAPVELAEDAARFHHVPPGPVNEVAARLFADVGGGDLVALGGGRVIDAAKAIAAVRLSRVAALPTTLSGAEMTRIHRLPEGQDAADGLVRPAVVLADPPLMVGLPEERLRASAMNALAHGADSLYTPLANPVSELAALRGARLLARALDSERSEPRSRSRWRSARCSAPTRSTRRCSAFTTWSARRSCASCGSPTPRPTRRCCRAPWRCCARAPARR